MSDINGLEITDVFGLSDPLSKLLETVSGGIGKVYEPIHIKRMAKAKAEELKLISAAVSDNITLPTIYENGKITVDSTNFEELMKRTQERFLFQELSKQSNIDAVVTKAYTELEKEEAVSDIPVDKDWTSRFFDSVANVSNEEMQDLWAKILAGEVKQPGSFSLRTLDTIKNLTQNEAQAYKKLAPLVMVTGGGAVIIGNKEIREKYNCSLNDILLLDECGLIMSNGTVAYNVNMPADSENALASKKHLIRIINETKNTINISFNIYPLTKAGEELYDIADVMPNEEYSIEVAKHIHENYSNKITVIIHKINYIDDKDGIDYDENPLKVFKRK